METVKVVRKKRVPISDKVLNKLVIAEAKALKKHATKKEKAELDFDRLDPDHQMTCIYGQITGHCFSDRASELIKASCKRVLKPLRLNGTWLNGTLNGSPKNLKGGRAFKYWSPIEVFIHRHKELENDNLKNLVAYLKGKKRTLKIV